MKRPASILDGATTVALVLDDYEPADQRRILDLVSDLAPGKKTILRNDDAQDGLLPKVATVVEVVSERSGLTTTEVADALGIENRTAGIRLANAAKLGLLKKAADQTWSVA